MKTCTTPKCNNKVFSKNLCVYHWKGVYGKPLVKQNKPINSGRTKEESKELAIWFAEQINIMPRACEETGLYISPYNPWVLCNIAHICQKRNVKSVATHPMNRMFYDADFHTNFDKMTSDEIKELKSYPLIVQRFNKFKHLIPQSEYCHLQDYQLELL